MLGIRLRVWLLVTILLAGIWHVYASREAADALPSESEHVRGAARSKLLPLRGSPLSAADRAHRPSSPGAPAPDTARITTPGRPDPESPPGTPTEAWPATPAAPRVDTQLVILEDEAARAALRRGLTLQSASGGTEHAPLEGAATNQTPAQNANAERYALSDELLIDHLSAETYRTTGFSRDQDAVGETRAAALSFIRSLTLEDRRVLLLSALADTAVRPTPVFEAAPRLIAIPNR